MCARVRVLGWGGGGGSGHTLERERARREERRKKRGRDVWRAYLVRLPKTDVMHRKILVVGVVAEYWGDTDEPVV